jgi:hypothetical protein
MFMFSVFNPHSNNLSAVPPRPVVPTSAETETPETPSERGRFFREFDVWNAIHDYHLAMYDRLLAKAFERGRDRITDYRQQRIHNQYRLSIAVDEHQRLSFYARRDGEPPGLIHDLERTEWTMSNHRQEIGRLTSNIGFMENYFRPAHFIA